ncbi:hypothetical protein EVAR_82708_1 [Eumeta japonica]|uniref:Uncharacterized protein n=1 Tax=Eumeta variegata TaxID=151549 RepID=A0A4C1YGX0_EUMVA|nr:hypothetical protein EVAR_82708_1 [Eumeta japonica]
MHEAPAAHGCMNFTICHKSRDPVVKEKEVCFHSDIRGSAETGSSRAARRVIENADTSYTLEQTRYKITTLLENKDCNVKWYNLKRKQSILYPNLQSAIRPIPHGTEIPVPKAPAILEEIPSSDEDGAVPEPDDKLSFGFEDDSNSKLFSQGELNDLDPVQWRIFIDSTKRSLKAVLLHNGGFYASIPVGHFVHLKKNLELVLCKLKYKDHGCQECGDFKILGMLPGQQSGLTKFIRSLLSHRHKNFFLCLLDSRDRANHWTKMCWPPRMFNVGEKNVLHETLVPPHKVLLPPLHIKLGLMKQFVKSLPREGTCFKYLISKFPGLSEAKLKEGVFIGPDIRRLMADQQSITTMTDPQREG